MQTKITPAKAAGGGLLAAIAVASALIAGFEGDGGRYQKDGQTYVRTYVDVVGVPTDCFGNTGRDVQRGVDRTLAYCRDKLDEEVYAHAVAAQRCLTRDPSGGTAVAFLSFAYNVGPDAFCRSTLVRKWNAGDGRGACDQLPRWNRAGGRVYKGLTIRRAEERRLCLEGLAR